MITEQINGSAADSEAVEEGDGESSPPARPGGFRRRASSVLRQLDAEGRM